MAAAANPHASEAGREMLRRGGAAIDAAIAMQAVLTLVEPQATGLGGGAFAMLWDGHAVHAYDGRETAPAGATEALFLRPDGKPMGFSDAQIGGRSVGVPGVMRMLELAHREHGRLPWKTLFEPAIRPPSRASRSRPACTERSRPIASCRSRRRWPVTSSIPTRARRPRARC